MSVIRAGRHADIERQMVCTELSNEHFALQQTAGVYNRSHYHALSSISCLAHPGPATALAFYDFVALLQQPLALTILALLLLLDVGAFFVGHGEFQTLMRVRYAVIAPMTDAGDPHRGKAWSIRSMLADSLKNYPSRNPAGLLPNRRGPVTLGY
jgi:hypothetical protein